MNDFLFYAIILALLYYFLVHLPKKQSKPPTKPLTQTTSTQTDSLILNAEPTNNAELAQLIASLTQDIIHATQQLKEKPGT